jgi:hypothetical protein
LVNIAWEKSFAKSELTRKAVRNRGWYPLNYCLLDHPNLIQLPTDEQSTPTNPQQPTLPVECPQVTDSNNGKPFVNTEGDLTGSYLQNLLNEESKSLGRKQKFEEQKRAREEKEKRIDALTHSGTTTSGQLAISNCWVLTPELLEKMKLKEETDRQKKATADAKRASKEDKENSHFTQSFQKFVANEKLTTTDLKNLLRKVKQRDDSPIRSKMVELKAQWEKRKHRFDAFRTQPGMTSIGTRTDDVRIQVGEI